MTREEKNTIAAVAAVLTLLVVVIGLTLGWSAWIWIPLAILPAVGGVVLAKQIALSRRPEPFPELISDQVPAPEPDPNQVALSEVSLPSAVPDYCFLVSGTVCWRENSKAPGRQHRNLDAVAKEAITSRAADALLNAQPHEHSVLSERLNVDLGTEQVVPTGHVYAWGEGFTVTLPEIDRNRLERLANLRKDVEMWEQERSHERNVREYLGDDVFSSPGSAVVWWLARHYKGEDSGVSAAVANIGNLRDLTAAVQEIETTEQSNLADVAAFEELWTRNEDGPWHSAISGVRGTSEKGRVGTLITWIDEIFAHREADERGLFVYQQARVLDVCGNREEADALRAHYNVEGPVPGAATAGATQDESAAAEPPAVDGETNLGPYQDL